MYLLKVLFKLNLVPYRESWYTTQKKKKFISGKSLACKILYKMKKKEEKKPYVKSFFISPS